MKLSNKIKRNNHRNMLREKRKEADRKNNLQIIKVLNPKQIELIKKYNCDLIQNNDVTKEDMLRILQLFFEVINNSIYIDEVLRMTRQNISTSWFDKDVNKDFIKEILEKEFEETREGAKETLALKLCYWANRISHQIQEEAMDGRKKHKMNDIYTKYYLNPKFHYDVTKAIDPETNKLYSNIEQKLQKLLIDENFFDGSISTPEQLHNLFMGLNIRNELWTLKQEMLKLLLKESQKNELTNIIVTALKEKKELSINGNSTLRLIIREKYGITPIIIHCEKEKIEEFLKKSNLNQIPFETSSEIIEFAKQGKVGIYFTLDEVNRDCFEYEALEDSKVDKLYKLMYRGESDDQGR